ncbi:hypothetical protein B1T49_27795, partial [Mycobacterium persicum]
SVAAGALVCAAGVALVALAKNGLGDVEGWTALGCFLAALLAARTSSGLVSRPMPAGRQSGSPYSSNQ